jgi:hypothetical protein
MPSEQTGTDSASDLEKAMARMMHHDHFATVANRNTTIVTTCSQLSNNVIRTGSPNEPDGRFLLDRDISDPREVSDSVASGNNQPPEPVMISHSRVQEGPLIQSGRHGTMVWEWP